ncbi:MAG: cytochrome P460 family protein [Myxococcales bacterium]|nr:cytochrome P460 family protein [Myxococcales bacterium]
MKVAGSICVLYLGSALLVAACDSDPGDSNGSGETSFVPKDFLSEYVEVRNCRFSIEHDSINIRVLTSSEHAVAFTDGIYPFPEGTIIAKAEYDDMNCSELLGVTAMRRLATGTSPETGDWEWQRLDAELVPQSIDQKTCAGCHTGCTEGRDMTCTNP